LTTLGDIRESMHPNLILFVCALGVLVGVITLQGVGRRIGKRRLEAGGEGARVGFGAVEGALFGLMGLLIAFTFSGAAARFDARRQLIMQEANTTRTAWLRLDFVSASAQSELRDLFRSYLDARLGAYRKLPDIAGARAELAVAKTIAGRIWERAVAATREPGSPLALHLILALNAMFDVSALQEASALIHPPWIIFAMLLVMVLMGALLSGHAMAGSKTMSRVHTIGFALILATTIYVVLDLEFPRLGFITVESTDQLLVAVRQDMK